MNEANEEDVPSPIDFHDRKAALAWEMETVAKRAWRTKFFAAFAGIE
jgi:hypothetical protein